MQSLILFFKGFLIGIGKIIPGVSGSVLAISMNVYEPALDKIANFKKNPWTNSQFLLPLGMGVGLSILLFSSIVLFFMEHHRQITMCFFLGLLLGTLPNLFRQKIHFHLQEYIISFLLVFLFYLLFAHIVLPEFYPTTWTSYIWIFFLGGIDALSMIVPGLSGTALFLLLGSYTFILKLFANPLENIVATFCFLFGFFFFALLIIKGLNKSFQKYPQKTWIVISSLIFFSLFEFLLNIPLEGQLTTILSSIFCLLLGFLFIQFLPGD